MKTFEELKEGDVVYVDGEHVNRYWEYSDKIGKLTVKSVKILTSETFHYGNYYERKEEVRPCNKLQITFDNDETIIIDMQFEKYRNRTSLSSGQGVCSFVATSFEEVKNHRIDQLKDKHKIIQDVIKSKNFELSEVLELIEFWNAETEEKYYVGQDTNSNN